MQTRGGAADNEMVKEKTTPTRPAVVQPLDEAFGRVFDDSPEPALLLDGADVVIDLNLAASTLLGLTRRELRGRRFADPVPRPMGGARGEIAVIAHDGVQRRVEYWSSAHHRPERRLVLMRVVGEQRRTERTTLTSRQREIFELLARGRNAPQIAAELFIAPATVRTHVQNAITRLGATTRIQAIVMALERGEIQV